MQPIAWESVLLYDFSAINQRTPVLSCGVLCMDIGRAGFYDRVLFIHEMHFVYFVCLHGLLMSAYDYCQIFTFIYFVAIAGLWRVFIVLG